MKRVRSIPIVPEGQVARRRYGRRATDVLLTQCWCQTCFVEVPAGEVREGRTVSCGRSGCEPPAA
jgi:hypothetical protein